MKNNKLFSAGLAVIAVAFSFNDTNAQNKVGNSNFSEASKTPRAISQIYRATGWQDASWGTVDFYHKNAKKCSRMGIPSNTAGSQEAFSGDGYAGIIAFEDDEVLALKDGKLQYVEGYKSYSEFITTQLSAPLVAGKQYKATFRVSLAENSGRAVSGLGIYFSKEAVDANHNSYIKATPQVKSTKVIDSKDQWVEVSGFFTATGGEQHLTIGLFNGPSEVKRAAAMNETNNKRAYYYIDGVGVTPGDFADRDKDGIADSEDACPDIAGKAEYDGCMLSKEDRMAIAAASAHIYFETGSAVIKKESFVDLDKLAEILKKHPEVRAAVEGHTDNTGNAANNMKLSDQRAASVKKYLIDKGEPADHISSKGYGITRPIASNDTKEGRAKNRRVAIAVSSYTK